MAHVKYRTTFELSEDVSLHFHRDAEISTESVQMGSISMFDEPLNILLPPGESTHWTYFRNLCFVKIPDDITYAIDISQAWADRKDGPGARCPVCGRRELYYSRTTERARYGCHCQLYAHHKTRFTTTTGEYKYTHGEIRIGYVQMHYRNTLNCNIEPLVTETKRLLNDMEAVEFHRVWWDTRDNDARLIYADWLGEYGYPLNERGLRRWGNPEIYRS